MTTDVDLLYTRHSLLGKVIKLDSGLWEVEDLKYETTWSHPTSLELVIFCKNLVAQNGKHHRRKTALSTLLREDYEILEKSEIMKDLYA